MNKTMRVLNAVLLALLGIGLLSAGISNKEDLLTGSILVGLVIWVVTLGSAWRAAGANATEFERKVAWWSNIGIVVLMACAALVSLFSDQGAAITLLLVATPMALNAFWLWKMRRVGYQAGPSGETAFIKEVLPVAPSDAGSNAQSLAQPDLAESSRELLAGPATANSSQPGLGEGGRRGSYFQRHWRGQLALPVSYWINGSLLSVVLLVVSRLVIEASEDLELRRVALLALGLLTVSIFVSVWSLVGIWRSAGHHVSRGGSAGWAGAAQVMTIIGMISLGVRLATEFGPQMKEYASIASGSDELGVVKVRVATNGQSLLLQGAFGTGSAAEVNKILSAAQGVRAIVLSSEGGRLWEAEQLAKLVRQRSLNTYVEDQCLSACTFVFLAGIDRAATPNAKIGFHQPSFPGMSAEDAGLRDMLELYRASGISEDFLAKVRATSSESMWYPTHDELVDNGVINRISLGGETASWAATFGSKRELMLAFRREPLMLAMEERFPGTLEQAVDAAWNRRQQGGMDAEVKAEMRSVFSSIYPKLLATADDNGLDGFLDLFVAQITAAGQLSDKACSLFLDGKLDVSKTLPVELIGLETQWSMEQLKATPAPARPVSTAMFEPVLTRVFDKLTPDQISVITDPKTYADRDALRCESFTAFYKEVRELPGRERSIVLRGMYQTPEQQ